MVGLLPLDLALIKGRVVSVIMFQDISLGLLFECDNFEKLSGLIQLLHNSQTLVESISVNAWKVTHEKFHPDLIVSQTLDFYFQGHNVTAS